MEIKRKLQLVAATVILNGTAALLGLYPATASADSCTPRLVGCTAIGQCLSNPTAWCQSLQPGCTVTSAMCRTNLCVALMYFCTYS